MVEEKKEGKKETGKKEIKGKTGAQKRKAETMPQIDKKKNMEKKDSKVELVEVHTGDGSISSYLHPLQRHSSSG